MAYVIVTGPPGSGKSTFADKLALVLQWPCLSKDTFKERLADSLGTGDEAWSHCLSGAALDLVFSVAARCPNALLEANFKPEEDLARIGALKAPKLQLYFTAPTEVLVQRVVERARSDERHPVHEDTMNQDDLAEVVREQAERSQPLPFDGPLFVVDTTEEVSTETAASWIRSEIANASSS